MKSTHSYTPQPPYLYYTAIDTHTHCVLEAVGEYTEPRPSFYAEVYMYTYPYFVRGAVETVSGSGHRGGAAVGSGGIPALPGPPPSLAGTSRRAQPGPSSPFQVCHPRKGRLKHLELMLFCVRIGAALFFNLE